MKRVHWVMRNLKTLRSLVLLSSFLFCATFHAQAALLGVGGNTNVWPGYPNLFSQTLAVQYTASNGLFTASGNTSDYFDINPPGVTNDNLVLNDYSLVNPGTFSLSATVTTNGTLVSGTVSIGSAAGVFDPAYDPTPIIGPGTLLQGTLTAFGFEGASVTNQSKFDFEFNVTGGLLASVYGSKAGTILYTDDNSFGGSFTTSFVNGVGGGEADTLMMVPEPEPQLLVILSVLGLCWVARWRVPLRKG
jgi:hypothetical protein